MERHRKSKHNDEETGDIFEDDSYMSSEEEMDNEEKDDYDPWESIIMKAFEKCQSQFDTE